MQKELTIKSQIIDGLNSQQKKAVTHNGGPLLIIAGAGTGKTTVITRRIAYLIEQKACQPSEILALTFTEKAAAEMENRVDQLVPYGYTDMWISTFHAFGDRLLRDYSLELGLPANFKILTAPEQAIFMRENLFAFDLDFYRPISDPTSHIQALLSHFSRLKDELISPEQYIEFAQSHKDGDPEEAGKLLEISKAYARYQELMMQAGNLDFGDQIYLTYKLLKENKKVLADCQKKFKYILVDEFQDTNYAQNEIVKLLALKDKNITVVGDDDQSIYKFRGASISNILQFKTSFPDAKEIVLTQNYRSTQEILDSSYKLIQHNNPDRLEVQEKINKRLVSKIHGTMPELLHCDTLSCEADTVINKIQSIKKDKGLKNNSFAILVRANSQAEPFIQSLNVTGIPYAFSGASGLFAQPEVRMLIAFLKCLVYTDDNIAFYQLATSELYSIPHNDLSEYYTSAKRKNRPVFELIINQSESEESKLKILTDDIVYFREKIKELNAGELLYDYLTKKGYLKELSKNPTTESELKIQHIAKFFDRIAQFNHSVEDKSLLSFLNNLELLIEVGDEVVFSDIDPDIDAVNILTVHAAKGLEWPVVFIVNCVADRFPSRNKRDPIEIPNELIKESLPEGNFHLEEERRLFYVASTRAKEYLFLTSADDYGGKRIKKLSQFVLELLDEPNPEKLKHKLSPIEKIERFKKIEVEKVPQVRKMIDGKIKLSRQQIDDYFTCPKKYYYAHIIKIPLLENQQMMYGTAIHAALDHYFNRKKRGEKVALESLLTDFKQAFRNVGFITREHENQRFKAGKKALINFFNSDRKETEAPSEIEQPFQFIENNVVVSGRFDLTFDLDGKTEIRDFKTSKVEDQKDADNRIKKSTQMKIYALAWQSQYSKLPETTLHFIESGLKAKRVFAEKELLETRNMISDVAKGIKEGNMKANPEFNACKWCPYRNICPDAK